MRDIGHAKWSKSKHKELSSAKGKVTEKIPPIVSRTSSPSIKLIIPATFVGWRGPPRAMPPVSIRTARGWSATLPALVVPVPVATVTVPPSPVLSIVSSIPVAPSVLRDAVPRSVTATLFLHCGLWGHIRHHLCHRNWPKTTQTLIPRTKTRFQAPKRNAPVRRTASNRKSRG